MTIRIGSNISGTDVAQVIMHAKQDKADAEFIAAAPENTRYLLDLARKQQAALAVVEEWLKTLDAIEEADPTTPTNRNVSAAGVASAIRAAVKTTLEAKP